MTAEPPTRASDARGQSIIPAWLRRAGAISWRVLAVAGLAAVLIWLSLVLVTVTASVLLALIVAATFIPLTRRLRDRGWSATRAAAAVTTAAVLVGAAAIALVVVALAPYVVEVFEAIERGIAEMEATVPAEATAPAAQAVEGVRAWVVDHLAEIAGRVAEMVTVTILSLFLTFFVLQDGARAWAWGIQVTEGWRRERIEASGQEALDRVGGYLRGTAILAAYGALAYLVILLVLGVPLAAPLAVLAFVGGFIPYLGPLVTVVAVVLVALGSVGAQSTIILFVLLAITGVVRANLLRPMIYSRSVNLHPVVVLVALPIGAYVGGVIGLFAAIPVVAFAAAFAGAVVDVLEPQPGDNLSRDVSGWLDRLAQWSWRALAVIGVLYGLVLLVAQVPFVTLPVILATVIAATVAPVAKMLRRRGWSSSRATLTVTGGAYLLLLLIVGLAIMQLAGPISGAVAGAVDGARAADAQTGLTWLEALSSDVGGELVRSVAVLLESVAGMAVIFVLAALLSFYFVRDGPQGWATVTRRATPWRRDELTAAGSQAVDLLGAYMVGTAAISAVGATSQFAIMVLLGLPFAVPIAILSFIACFIPYIGGFVTTGLAFLVAVAFGDPTQIAVMAAFTLVINIVQGNIVTPLVYNRAVNLHPAVVLLAIPAGGALAGIAGMFLAVPFLAVVATTWRTVLRVLGDKPEGGPEAAPTQDADPAAVPTVAPALHAPAE